MLFKIEAAVKLGLNHQSNTRTACVWHCYYKEKVILRMRQIKKAVSTQGELMTQCLDILKDISVNVGQAASLEAAA
ncbi:hypothetical protein GOODEAATRI_005083 [Goodea atripinnis]|uniref:Uncharacterized protein n=1 Tax=Goodea atripinnis TaxID=208336 RepID=A0ABV0MI06_9TELE